MKKSRVPKYRSRIRQAKEQSAAGYDVILSSDYGIPRQLGLDLRRNMRLDLNGVVAFQTLNKIKEIEVKNKILRGEKIRVAFVIDALAKFTGANVYKIMRNDPLFEPFVVLYNLAEGSLEMDAYWYEYKRELQELQEKGFKVEPGYDKERHYLPLELYKPDIVFVSAFYLDSTRMSINNTLMNISFLVCQLPYGFNVINSYEYHFNNRQINCAWKYFTATRDEFNELRNYSLHYGVNAVYSGSTRLDDYATPASRSCLPEKLQNDKPIVIYAPHWTVQFNVNLHDLASFDLYCKNFLEMAKSTPDCNFVFKPHPSLEYRVQNKGVMTLAQYHDYCAAWDNLPNGLCFFSGDVIKLFQESSLLITDSGSFIYEWLPSGQPCIYLGNPRRTPAEFMDSFETGAKKILATYYMSWNWEEICQWFNNLLRFGIDPLAEKRRKLIPEIFPRLGEASQYIVDYLKTVLAS